MEAKKWTFDSSSSDRTYETVRWADGTYSCNCPGWTNKKNGIERTCKHIKSVANGGEPAAAPVVKAAYLPQFIKPMLAHLGEDKKTWSDARWIAEPKFDGQRALVLVRGGKTAACYSREGNDLLSTKANGVAWLKGVKWPFDSAALDGEICSGGGLCTAGKDIQHARSTAGLALDLVVFDLLEIMGTDLKGAAWVTRRFRLDAAFKKFKHKQIQVTPVSKDPAALWSKWVEEMGGEGIMLKDTEAVYRPGHRSPQWLKFKMEITVDVVITGVTDRATYQSGGYRTAEAALTYGYWDKKAKKAIAVGQGVKLGSRAELQQYLGKVAEMRCAGVTPKGALRSGFLVRWRDDKPAKQCTKPGEV